MANQVANLITGCLVTLRENAIQGRREANFRMRTRRVIRGFNGTNSSSARLNRKRDNGSRQSAPKGNYGSLNAAKRPTDCIPSSLSLASLSTSNSSVKSADATLIGGEIASNSSQTNNSYTCFGCKQSISDKFLLEACEKFWHENCLKCDRCQTKLGELGPTLYRKSELNLCRQDYLEMFGQTAICSVCQKLIYASEMVMRAKENVYHLECFACQFCGQRFCVGDRFYLFENKIICQFDYEEHLIPIQKSLVDGATTISTTVTGEQGSMDSAAPLAANESNAPPSTVASACPADADANSASILEVDGCKTMAIGVNEANSSTREDDNPQEPAGACSAPGASEQVLVAKADCSEREAEAETATGDAIKRSARSQPFCQDHKSPSADANIQEP